MAKKFSRRDDPPLMSESITDGVAAGLVLGPAYGALAGAYIAVVGNGSPDDPASLGILGGVVGIIGGPILGALQGTLLGNYFLLQRERAASRRTSIRRTWRGTYFMCSPTILLTWVLTALVFPEIAVVPLLALGLLLAGTYAYWTCSKYCGRQSQFQDGSQSPRLAIDSPRDGRIRCAGGEERSVSIGRQNDRVAFCSRKFYRLRRRGFRQVTAYAGAGAGTGSSQRVLS